MFKIPGFSRISGFVATLNKSVVAALNKFLPRAIDKMSFLRKKIGMETLNQPAVANLIKNLWQP